MNTLENNNASTHIEKSYFSEDTGEAKVSMSPLDVKRVGGTIFYIDNNVNSVYEFFDTDGNRIKNVQIGDRPYYYRVIEKGYKDKYYVYHDKVYDALRWNYCKKGKYVYESLNTSDGIRTGKINTEVVMAKDNGAYITIDSKGFPTIWYQLQQTRLAQAGGCDDWFIPSIAEIEELRLAIKSGSITGGTIAGSSYEESAFGKSGGYYLWSSSEYSSQYAWGWNYFTQYWYCSSKGNVYSVFFVRAF